MGKIMLDTSFPNSPAWLEEGGAYAMALHLGALAYSDQHGLDGIIPERLVPHVSLAVSPGDVPDALKILLDFGFWTKMSRDKYAIQEYERTNFTKAQADAFRDREATKKRRQRLHGAGDHSLCTSAKWCAHVKEQEQMSRGDKDGTRPSKGKVDTRGPIPSPYESIRPLGSMDGMDVGPDAPDSAGATSSARPGRHETQKTVDAETAAEVRWLRERVTEDTLGRDPALMPDEEFIHAVYAHVQEVDREGGITPMSFKRWALEQGIAPEAFADPADTLAGLIPAGAADGDEPR